MKISHVFIFVGMLMLASCSKMPVYKSKSYNQQTTNESPNSIADNFDKKANVRYGFANDNSHFYIQAEFSDRESLMKIMRGGLIVYFDPNGKKGKDYQLKIEKSDQQLNEYTMLSNQRQNSGNGDRQGERQNMPSTIAAVLSKVTWDKNGKELVFYNKMQKEPILVELLPAAQDQLTLSIKMPLSEIPLSANNSTFSLGIATGKDNMKGMSGNQPGGGGGGMGGPGGGMGGGSGPGGGMGGPGGGGMGGPGGGGMGGPGGGGRPDGAPSSSGTSPIEIWCKVQL
jgi:hypothetical protein